MTDEPTEFEDIYVEDPFLDWIEVNQELLQPFRNNYLAIDMLRLNPVVIACNNEEDFIRELEALGPYGKTLETFPYYDRRY